MSSPLTVLANLVELDDSEIATTGIAIVAFLDSDNDLAYRVVFCGDTTASTVVGLLHMTAHGVSHDANPTPCEGE